MEKRLCGQGVNEWIVYCARVQQISMNHKFTLIDTQYLVATGYLQYPQQSPIYKFTSHKTT